MIVYIPFALIECKICGPIPYPLAVTMMETY